MFNLGSLGNPKIIIEQVTKSKQISESDSTRMEVATLKVDVRTSPDRAMSMMMTALVDLTERFITAHNRMLKPCDCLAIRYANIIQQHAQDIQEEMATMAEGQIQQEKINKEKDEAESV